MHIFITGASGWIGSAAAAELIAAGHEITGLARSDASADALVAAGIAPLRGDLRDTETLRAGAETADGVLHLGFIHDFSDYVGAGLVERAAVTTLGDALAGSDRPLVVASGVAGARPGHTLVETDASPFDTEESPRGGSENVALVYAERGVRAMAVRFAPTVHGSGDHGFMAELVRIARATGVSGYVGDGANVWPAVHRRDAASIVRRALEHGSAGSRFHAVAEEGVPTRDIAEAIGRGLGLAVEPVAAEDAADHFGWLGGFFSGDLRTSSTLTRRELGWSPTHPTLIEDLDSGVYFG
jgi:nucleoside-diphosphate-sugar epimerase